MISFAAERVKNKVIEGSVLMVAVTKKFFLTHSEQDGAEKDQIREQTSSAFQTKSFYL